MASIRFDTFHQLAPITPAAAAPAAIHARIPFSLMLVSRRASRPCRAGAGVAVPDPPETPCPKFYHG